MTAYSELSQLQIDILEIFAEAAKRVLPRKLRFDVWEIRRDRQRGHDLNVELDLRARLRTGVRPTRCPHCGGMAEAREGLKSYVHIGKGAKKGCPAVTTLTPEQASENARHAVQTRWDRVRARKEREKEKEASCADV